MREKCVETCRKASKIKALRHFGATPKPWVAGSSPPAPAKKIKSTFFVGFFFLPGYNLRRTRRGAVVNDNTVCCQSRGRPRSVAKPKSKTRLCVVATRPSPPAPAKQKSAFVKKADFLFVLFVFHYSIFIIHLFSADFQ